MAKIKARILAALGDAYNVGGGQIAPETIALASEIQIVHDVGRQVEFEALSLSAVGRGFFMITIPTTNGAGDTVRGTKDVYVELGALSPVTSARLDAWLLGCYFQGGAAQTSWTLSVHFPSTFPTAGTPSTGMPLLTGTNGTFSGSDAAGAGDTNQSLAAVANGFSPPYPLFLPRGSILSTRTITLAGTNVSVFLLWAGLAGTRPPGVA